MQNRKFKKLSTFIAATMLSVVTVGTTAFASPQFLFDSQEERFGPRGETEQHIELIMTILPKNIDVQLKMVMV